ncbi:MAG: ATP-binding protein [Pseudomonadota bacterium]
MDDTALTSLDRPGEIRLRLDPDAYSVRCALAVADRWLQSFSMTPDLKSNVAIVLGEVLNNVVEHAFAMNKRAKVAEASHDAGDIWVDLNVSADTVHIFVKDSGGPMQQLSLPEGALPHIPDQLSDIPEGGFGWFLIRELASDLRYTRQDGWNLLELTVRDPALAGRTH